MNRIGLIQLSDLQFGEKHVFGFPSNISQRLIVDITSLAHRHSFVPSYLLVSGDVAETGNGGEFLDGVKEISRIAQGVSIDRTSVLVIPGNHDVNWEMSKIEESVGAPGLRLRNFYDFRENFGPKMKEVSAEGKPLFPYLIDGRNGLIILMIDSCPRESHENHEGFVDESVLLNTIENLRLDYTYDKSYVGIAMLHHRLDVTGGDVRSAVTNYENVTTILLENDFNVTLTGHVHESSFCHLGDGEKTILKSGAGSAGVDKTQRLDGMPNQYTLHIIDRQHKRIETIFRAYNPRRVTQLGMGGWVNDNTFESNNYFDIPFVRPLSRTSEDVIQDKRLEEKIGIVANPFTYNNAEKISPELLLQMFVSDGARHKEAKRLVGDAIIRGPRGAGKTMFLRFLDIYGSNVFLKCLDQRRTAECFPVFVKFDLLHKSEIGNTTSSIFDAADRLIYESVLRALDDASKEFRSLEFTSVVGKIRTRLDSLKDQSMTRVSRLGIALSEYLTIYSKHVLLLIDEVANVFPKEFFQDTEEGFVAWMNTIRSSGPFFTRVAVYPSDLSDVLNEERFGTLINLEYNVRNQLDYQNFYEYCVELVNRYLRQKSKDEKSPVAIYDIFAKSVVPQEDAIEQLIYASDGSTRRFLTLIDRSLAVCMNDPNPGRARPLTKKQVTDVIRGYAENLASGYPELDQQLAAALAKACRKQVTFRFKAPGLSIQLNPLHAAREEFNLVRLCDAGAGRRGAIYEFTYPFCIYNDLQTHNIKDSRKVDSNRSLASGEWITQATTIKRDELEVLKEASRSVGTVEETDGQDCLITDEDSGNLFLGEAPSNISVGDKVAYIKRGNTAVDVVVI